MRTHNRAAGDGRVKRMKKNESRTRNTLLNAVTSVGGHLLATVLKFVVRTVFIHTLGKSYLGINGLFSDILSMLSLTELGFDVAINFRLYKPLAEKDDKRVRVLLKFYKQAYRVIGTVILLLGLCLIPALPVLIRDYETLEVLGINAVLIFLLHIGRTVCSYWFFAYRSAIMKANQKRYILELVGYIITLATNIAKILVLVFLKDFVLYTATVIVFNVLQNFINAIITKRRYPEFFEKEEDKLSKAEVRDLIEDCLATFALRVNGVVLKATDNLVISAFIGISAVGLYSNYLLFYTTIKSFFWRIYTATTASMGNLFATSDVAKRYGFFKIMNYLTAVLYGTAGVGLAVCADEFITVWVGESYLVAQPFAILIGIETYFLGLQRTLDQIRNVSGVFRQMWVRPIIGAVLNVIISIVFVHICGLYGVIIGTIASVILSNLLIDPTVIYRHSFENYRPVSEYYVMNLLYIGVLAVVTVIDMKLCSVFFVGNGWYSVIVHALIVAVSVPGVLIAIWWRSPECQYFIRLVTRVGRKALKKIG